MLSQANPTLAGAVDPTLCGAVEAPECEAATEPAERVPDVAGVAMSHINTMRFKHFKTDADLARARAMVRDCVAEAVSSGVNGADPSTLAATIVGAFDKINSARREATARRNASSEKHPPLQVYPRWLGFRSRGKRKRDSHSDAYAYDTRWEEVLEREFDYDPQLIAEIELAHLHWRQRSIAIRKSDRRDPNRTFDDICDGEMWQEHPHLGDPSYSGPTRMGFEGYCDEVDVPNGIGTAAGHHKLWISFFVVLNRPPKTRATLRSIHLATILLASDFKQFGARASISGKGLDNSIGGTMRRFDAGVVLKTPPSCGFDSFPVRGWLGVWTADGLAQGEVYGTNSSFSKAINICNLCEDMDQRTPRGRKPCKFLACKCPSSRQAHRPECPCHFRLRTPERDAARNARRLTKVEMQKLGIVTLDHGLVDVPHVRVARPGPKEPMHALFEGRTKHLAAFTCWSIVHAGLATVTELCEHAHAFEWSPGCTSTTQYRSHYIPESIFVRTKVEQPDGSWVWGPHKDAKLPYTASGMVTFTVMSIPFFRRFIPSTWTLSSSPAWWRAWVLHAHAACATLCYHFTLADLLRLEGLFVDSERAIAAHPPYADVWIPKAHWILHIALDIFWWGPSRLLWTFLKEMKLAAFKNGCKRSNFKNPVKSTAIFWCEQSDWQCQQADFSRTACSDAVVLVQGTVADFPDSQVLALLLEKRVVQLDSGVQFLSKLDFHGVTVLRSSGVLVGRSLYWVERLLACQGEYFVWLRLVPAEFSVNSFGQTLAHSVPASDSSCRLMSLHHGSQFTPVYLVPDGPALVVTVKF